MVLGCLFRIVAGIILVSHGAFGQTPVGAIFDQGNLLLQAAFEAAAEVCSTEERPIEPKSRQAAPGDILEAGKHLCSLVEESVMGIIGPTNKISMSYVQSICDSLDVPHIITEMDELQERNWTAVNLYPHQRAVSKAFYDIIQAKGWKEFAILYEDPEALGRIDSILNLSSMDSEYVIGIRQLSAGDNFRQLLIGVKQAGFVNILVDCNVDTLEAVMIQAQQVGLMADAHSYIIMSPDMHTLDLEPYQHGGANITGTRLTDPENEELIAFTAAFNEKYRTLNPELSEDLTPEQMRLQTVLVHDAVKVYINSLNNLGSEITFEGLSCKSDASWNFGTTIINHIRTSEVETLSGVMKFDADGYRSEFDLDILELGYTGLAKVGTWSFQDGYVEARPKIAPTESESNESMKNKTFVVITALTAPYGMRRESPTKLEGNERYEGFGIELMEEIAKILEFNITFELQMDGVYGSLDKSTGKWSGMMEKVMDGRADFAITDLTITADRESAVDFTSPFMNLGISILYKKPMKQPPDLFSFMSPFSTGVWMWLAGAYVGVSVLLFVLGRICPEEWQNPYPCIQEPETLENQFTLSNAFWFTLGSVLTQGSEIAPIGISTRIAGSIWWFFTLIMVSSYTANLAAFLTVESKFSPITGAEDLYNNPYDIKYGAKKGGATLSFFKYSENELYQNMFAYMDSHPENMPNTNDEGLLRVKSEDENYAFLMESTSIEYIVERNCDVAQIGGLIDNKGYGIAMKKNSPYRNIMSGAVLQLQEVGKITSMKNKWWKEKRGGGACSDDDSGGGGAVALSLANVGGVFIVLSAGSAMAIVCAFCEMLVDVAKTAAQHKVSFKAELIEELKFIFKFSEDPKPVRHRSRSTETSASLARSHSSSGSQNSKETTDHTQHALHSRRSSVIARQRKFT